MNSAKKDPARRTGRYAAVVALALAAVYFAVFYALHLAKWTYFDPSCLDVGGIVYFSSEFANGHLVSGLQFTPFSILVLIGALVFDTIPYTLLLMPLFTALQLVALFLIVRRLTGSAWLALALQVSYALNPWVEWYSFFGYKPTPVGLAFLFLFVHAVLTRRARLATAFAVLSMAAKIDFVPVVFLTAAWFYFRREKKTVRPALIAAVVVGCAMLAGLIHLALQNKTGGSMGATFDPIRVFFASQDAEITARSMVSPFRLRLLTLFAPTFFLGLLAPYPTFVPGIFHILLTLGFADVWEQSVIGQIFGAYPDSIWRYLPRVPIVWVGLIYLGAAFGIRRLLDRWGGTGARRSRMIAALTAALLVAGAAYHEAASVPIAGPLPLTSWWSQYSYRYGPTDGSRYIRGVLDEIDAGSRTACLSQQYPYHLDRYLAGGADSGIDQVPCDVDRMAPDLILVDLYLSTFPPRDTVLAWTREVLADPRYEVVSLKEGILLLRRADGGETVAETNRRVLKYLDDRADVLDLNMLDRELYKERLGPDRLVIEPPPAD